MGQEGKGANGGEGPGQMELGGPVGVGAGALAENQVIQPHILLQGACGADTENVFHAKDVVELVGVYADGGHSHAGSHNGDLDAPIGAGIALDAPDVIYQDGIFQEGFRNELGPQGIPGHEDGLAKVAGFGVDVGGGIVHGSCSFPFGVDVFRPPWPWPALQSGTSPGGRRPVE